jgi:uncharacterized cupredoxin-like copper-binding protein
MVLAFAILVSGCSEQRSEPILYTIDLSEYAYTPNALEVRVGQEVTLKLMNSGVLPHELMIGREVVISDNRPSGYAVDLFAQAGVEPTVSGGMEAMGEHGHGASGVMVTLPNNGDESTLTFTVTEDMVGEWEMGCFEQDGVHYTAGMKGKFIVTK